MHNQKNGVPQSILIIPVMSGKNGRVGQKKLVSVRYKNHRTIDPQMERWIIQFQAFVSNPAFKHTVRTTQE
jgi:hypothetical protein